jgi:hypothetical protein
MLKILIYYRLHMITKYTTYIKENKKYTFDDVFNEFYQNYVISMYFDEDKKINTIHIESPDYLNQNGRDFNNEDADEAWDENFSDVQKVLEKTVSDSLNEKDFLNIPNDKFLLFRYLAMKFHKKFGWGEIDEDADYIDIFFYGTSARILSGNLKECLEDFEIYNYNVEEYVEQLIKENSKIFNNKYFLFLIENVDYLYTKYKHYIDANNFDIL